MEREIMVELMIATPFRGGRMQVNENMWGDAIRNGVQVEVWTRDLLPGDMVFCEPDENGIHELLPLHSVRVFLEAAHA